MQDGANGGVACRPTHARAARWACTDVIRVGAPRFSASSKRMPGIGSSQLRRGPVVCEDGRVPPYRPHHPIGWHGVGCRTVRERPDTSTGDRRRQCAEGVTYAPLTRGVGWHRTKLTPHGLGSTLPGLALARRSGSTSRSPRLVQVERHCVTRPVHGWRRARVARYCHCARLAWGGGGVRGRHVGGRREHTRSWSAWGERAGRARRREKYCGERVRVESEGLASGRCS
jgi:hypothetical protein